MPRQDLPPGARLAGTGAGAIPRLIYQTVPESPSPEVAANVRRIRDDHPGWDHRLFDDSDILAFVSRAYGWSIARYFERVLPGYGAVKADLFRYLALYHTGGVYLDAKSRPLRPLDEIVRPDDRYVLAQWRNRDGEPFAGFGLHKELAHVPGGEFQQWHLLAAPRHPFLKAVIERVLRNFDAYNPALHGVGQHGVLRLSGPVAYTLAIAPLLHRHPHRRVRSEADLDLSYSIYDGLDHRRRAAGHYSRADGPIVQVGAATHVLAQALEAGRRLKRQIRPA